jgi:hypothetical protein
VNEIVQAAVTLLVMADLFSGGWLFYALRWAPAPTRVGPLVETRGLSADLRPIVEKGAILAVLAVGGFVLLVALVVLALSEGIGRRSGRLPAPPSRPPNF